MKVMALFFIELLQEKEERIDRMERENRALRQAIEEINQRLAARETRAATIVRQ